MKTVKQYEQEAREYQEKLERDHKAMLAAGRQLADQARQLAHKEGMTFESAWSVILDDQDNKPLVKTYFAGVRHQEHRATTYGRK